MRITNQVVASKLSAYLHYQIGLSQLVDWAENAIMDGEFGGKNSHALAATVGRIGVADVREFGLTWEDFTAILKELGYTARVDVIAPNHRPIRSDYWREKAERYESHGGITPEKSATSNVGKRHCYAKRPTNVPYSGTRGGSEREVRRKKM
ncbi:MAG TPA: hypothetical protein VFX22_11540 [Candidatus Kapabacteria bacterium]|nr:hypothetical protein [Candidatus Kapabacteria bacterium]